MLLEARLGWRLIWGSRGRDLVRFAAVVLSGTLVGWALALGLCIALLGSHEVQVEAARAPVRAETGSGLWVSESSAVIGGRPWIRVTVSASVRAIPPPPGLAAWPAPGASSLSPALADLLETPLYEPLLPGETGPPIAWKGLTSPAELYSYTVLAPGTELGSSFREIVGFGRAPLPGDAGSDSVGLLTAVALILAGPAMLAFSSAFRFLLASHSRRFGIMVRMGAPEGRISRLFAAECATLTGSGLGMGFALHAASQAAIGGSGWLSVSWWPEHGHISPWLLVAVVLVAMVGAWRAATRMLRSSRRRAPRPESTSRPAVGGIAHILTLFATAFLLGLLVYSMVTPPTLRQPPLVSTAVLIAVGVGAVGILLGMPRWSRTLSRYLGDSSPDPAVRLGLRGASHFAAAGNRFLTALVMLCVVAGCASGFISGVGCWGTGYDNTRTVTVDNLAALAPDTVKLLLDDLAEPFVVMGYDPADAVIVSGTCEGVTAFDEVVRANAGRCAENQIQIGDELGLARNHASELTLDASKDRVALPDGPIVDDVRWSVKLPEEYRYRLARLPGAAVIKPATAEEGFIAALGHIYRDFPQVPVHAGLKDPESYEVHKYFSAIFQVSFAAAVAIAAAALALLAFEITWSNAGQWNALAGVGVRRRDLMVATAIRAAWPVVVVLPAGLFGILAGVAVRMYFGTSGMFESSIFAGVIGPWGVAFLLATAAGLLAAPARFHRDKMSDA